MSVKKLKKKTKQNRKKAESNDAEVCKFSIKQETLLDNYDTPFMSIQANEKMSLMYNSSEMSSTVDKMLSPKLNKEQGNLRINNKTTISIVQEINPYPKIT